MGLLQILTTSSQRWEILEACIRYIVLKLKEIGIPDVKRVRSLRNKRKSVYRSLIIKPVIKKNLRI